jgi:pilus assembly protein CpaB
MSGKMPIFAVLGLGLVAAVCSAVLMAAMRSGSPAAVAAPTTTHIVVVTADLPSMTRITKDHIETREVQIADMPAGAFTDPVQLLGRLVRTALVAGQPIVETGLLKDEGGMQLASSLPSGMRAVSVEINGSSAMRGLLFPGCSVDVIVSYKAVISRTRGEGPVSRTLLQNVSVLAVEDKTVFTVEPEEGEDGASTAAPRRSGRGLMVTLMVDPQQARELQAARDTGELSLSLRNPLDGSLTADPMALPAPTQAAADQTDEQTEDESTPWRTVVFRGDKTEVMVFGEDGKKAGENPGENEDRRADVPIENDDGVE